MEWYVYVIIVAVVAYAFRKQLLKHWNEYYGNYKANKKQQDLYNRLDRNAAGRWDQKAYLKNLNEQKKKQRIALKNRQDDLK